ncbi:MAG: hypothetical protein KGI50_07360 [Patescibacteria group bacterium]|nr:hypothetical protein [Patescibacteria group bacterium]
MACLTIGTKIEYLVYFDDEDALKVVQHSWQPHVVGTNVYASRRERCKKTNKMKRIYLHRWLLGVEDPKVFVDHDDRNGLNCRKANLIITDLVGNNKNRTYGLAANAKRIKGIIA